LNRRRSAILAIALSLSLTLGACGDDSSPSVDDDDAGESGGSGDNAFTVTLTESGIEIPDEVTGGVVHVTLESDIEGGNEANFSKVTAGTTEDQFKQAVAGLVTGGPIPAFIEATTGVLGKEDSGSGESTIILPEGDYIAWSLPEPPDEGGGEGGGEESPATTAAAAGETARGQEGEPEGEGGGQEQGPPPEAVLTSSFKVTPGEAGDLPDTDENEIVARDYSFDVKVKAGAKQFVFRNKGPDQIHHVVLFNFGTVSPADVEENLPAFFESGEDAPPPPAFKDVDFKNLEAGDGPVLSPGLAATTLAKGFESGSTYAAVCFIQDRTGGPPHAIAKGMRTVFTVE